MESGKQPLSPAPSIAPLSLAPLEERSHEPVVALSLVDSAALSSLDCLIEKNSVLQISLEVQGQAHLGEFCKISEDTTVFHEEFLCRYEFQSVLEKVYSFQHLMERLWEAEGGLEAIRGEGRALFDRFQAHERSLVADLVDLFLSYTGTTPISPDAWLGGSRWQVMQTLRMKRALRDGPDTLIGWMRGRSRSWPGPAPPPREPAWTIKIQTLYPKPDFWSHPR